jgi:hypothetical protein
MLQHIEENIVAAVQKSISRETLVAVLKSNPSVTREQLAKLLCVSSEDIKGILQGLKAEGVVDLKGERRGARYSWVGAQSEDPQGTIRITGEDPEQPRMDINKRFGMMTRLVKAMVTGENNSMIILGQGGTGKTSSVLRTLAEQGLEARNPGQVCEPHKHYLHVKGVAAATELYRILFENPEALVLFDDCDSVLEEGNGMNVLKAVLDTFPERTVSWISTYVQKTMGLPESFEFKGKIIFVTNKQYINQALKSRSLIVDLNMTTKELCDRLDMIGRKMNEEITEEEHTELIAFLRENATKFADLSLRTYAKIANLITAGETDWRELAMWSN